MHCKARMHTNNENTNHCLNIKDSHIFCLIMKNIENTSFFLKFKKCLSINCFAWKKTQKVTPTLVDKELNFYTKLITTYKMAGLIF